MKNKIKHHLLNSQSSGLSIMLAVVLTSIIVIFAIGVATVVTDSVRQANNVKQGTTAYYAAEQGVEQALFANTKLTQDGSAIGADSSGTATSAACDPLKEPNCAAVKYKVSGLSKAGTENQVNGKYIVPFPWTGNAPWHGQGSSPEGGCNPQKPPARTGTGVNKEFLINDKTGLKSQEIEHPCNWGTLKPGQKVAIPLYSPNASLGAPDNKFPEFSIRLRTPCKDGQEMCTPGDRLELNCWDKGSEEGRCVTKPPKSSIQVSQNYLRGETVLLWQINAQKAPAGTSVSLIPNSIIIDESPKYYEIFATQIYENKINIAKLPASLFTVLSTINPTQYPPNPRGEEIADTNISTEITDFIASNNKPVLSLSLISNLIGCAEKNSCYSSSKETNIPYLEYQIIFASPAAGSQPANQDNIISAEGQSGPFNQTIEVKVPTDNSGIEYVIQQ